MNPFGKRLADVTIDDVKALIGRPENEHLEFKRGLDGWDGQQALSGEVRDKILREVIAFANANGGTVVIGMEETDDHPHCAKALSLLPNAADLADRLSKQAQSAIDPEIPMLRVVPVADTQRTDGVVLIEVPKVEICATPVV